MRKSRGRLITCIMILCIALGFHRFTKGQVDTAFILDPIDTQHLRTSSSELYYLKYSGSVLSIVRLARNGQITPWMPFDQDGSFVWSISPSDDGEMYLAYSPSGLGKEQYEMIVSKTTFGSSLHDEIWQSNELLFRRFQVTDDPRIYALGYKRNRLIKEMKTAPLGTQFTFDLFHIIEPLTGKEVHLFPVTVSSEEDRRIESALATAALAVKSNGNYFVVFNPFLMKSYGWNQLISREAVEYSPSGTVVKTWDLGLSGKNGLLNNVFVTADDRLIADIFIAKDNKEGISRSECNMYTTIEEHYLVEVDLDGRVTRAPNGLVGGEPVIGWLRATQEIVSATDQYRRVSLRQVSFR